MSIQNLLLVLTTLLIICSLVWLLRRIMQTNNEPKPIATKDELIQALKDVAELEHQFMCMYLYAAFSLKKNTDDSCNAAQLEAVRRWASKIYMIARQEMEHLSVVNSMLAAIGAPPHFSRQNIPAQSLHLKAKEMHKRYGLEEESHLKPCNFPFIFEPFDYFSAMRYACMESPKLEDLPVEYKDAVEKWCFQDGSGKCHCLPDSESILTEGNGLALQRSYYFGIPETDAGESGSVNAVKGVEVGTIQEFYKKLRNGFITVAQQNKPPLFVEPYHQHQVEIPNEYDIYLFPVTDLNSALSAMEVITQQGEGLDTPPDFDTHFLNFYEIAQEYQKLKLEYPNFEPFLPVPRHPNPQTEDIKNEFTKKVFKLFNDSYVTLLYVLTGLYGWYKPRAAETSYPHLSTALAEITFGPAMTMLVRSLGEVLVKLPLAQDPNHVAAPTFHISKDEDTKLLIDASDNEWQSNSKYSFYTDIGFYIKRFEDILKVLQTLPSEVDHDLAMLDENVRQELKTRLTFIYQNVYRMTGNLRQIYQTGFFSKFEGVT